MKQFILAGCIFLTSLPLAAQNPRTEFKADLRKSASNYYAYPDDTLPTLTPAPVGYAPFHIEHYGRHGSRWLIQPRQYNEPVRQLSLADKHGLLTPEGRTLLTQLHTLQAASNKRLGELTDVGAEQHQRIARRMFAHFPEVFADSARVDARSTVVIRCILSMANEAMELRTLNPALRITQDASEADMHYMNFQDTSLVAIRKQANPEVQRFIRSCTHPNRLMSTLVRDTAFVRDSLDAHALMIALFDIAGNMQSHHSSLDFQHLFTENERYDLWCATNAWWYVNYGPSPLTHGRAPYSQRNLLRNFLQSADAAINGKGCEATLRFGHESCLLPLACLMELNECGKEIANLNNIADSWQNFRIYPMGCNIQWIFYRKPGSDDILIKVLLNEREATLPLKTDKSPYYHWRDVRAYYESKL